MISFYESEFLPFCVSIHGVLRLVDVLVMQCLIASCFSVPLLNLCYREFDIINGVMADRVYHKFTNKNIKE